MADLAVTPVFTSSIDQRFLIEPLGGPKEPRSYLDRFPEEVYNKSIDSHLVKFMYAMLGPAGAGYLRRNYLQARLLFEANGLELFDLDEFYGSPFQFGRISDEIYTADIQGLIPQEEWEQIRSKDSKYRNRIIDFISGARAGNTPFGMRLVARSGLGHEVEIIENYKALFDQNTDDPLGLPYRGKTRLINEMIVLPRQEAPKIEEQTLMIMGTATGGGFTLTIDDKTTSSIPYDAEAREAERQLSKIIDINNVIVAGGPLPTQPLSIKFIGALAGSHTQITGTSALIGSSPQLFITDVVTLDSADSTSPISPQDQKHLQEALDRVRPVTVIPTFAEEPGNKARINWNAASASSEFDEMIRFATGSGGIKWSPIDSVHWIEQGAEHQAPRAYNDLQYHYAAFHAVAEATSYDETALTSSDYETSAWDAIKIRFASDHYGTFEPHHSALYPFLRLVAGDEVTGPDKITADYTEPLTVTRVVETTSGPVGMINGLYPSDYQSLPGAPTIKYTNDQWWSSRERTAGDEYIELDLGDVRAINYLAFEISRKPIDISIDYDILGVGGDRDWRSVTLNGGISSPTTMFFSATEQNPWRATEYYFNNAKGEMIYARYLRLRFRRRDDGVFLRQGSTLYPWSVDVRNLRIGRNVANQ